MRFPMQMVLVGAISLGLANGALADAYVCQETASSGLNWTNGAWSTVTFSNDTLIVRAVDRDDQSAACYERADERAAALSHNNTEDFKRVGRCYTIAKIGEESYPDSCVTVLRNDEVFYIECSGFSDFGMNEDREFVRSSTRMALTPFTPGDERDSIYVSAGKCTTIE